MGVLSDLKGGYSSGGSSNTAQSISQTYGTAATQASVANAASANQAAMAAWREQAAYNAEQARLNRDWQERMANSVYQRTIADMKKAGINPILAAGMGLGTAAVGSGATASVSNPSTYMANAYADQNSASFSQGSSWNQSENGLATGLQLLGEAISGALEKMNAGQKIDIAINGIEQLMNGGKETDSKESTKKYNQTVNGSKNPFRKGTHAYELWELEHAFKQTIQ